uniref:Uncharacterized protein n=1 Tax=Calidris pygmaea TaxID=425635 RepID=A0A8C3JMJ7_9CHAR
MASGLLVYPFGFNSAIVKRFCENSDIYYAGDCQIGWGYMLAIVGPLWVMSEKIFVSGNRFKFHSFFLHMLSSQYLQF